jgi:hypothetical protein
MEYVGTFYGHRVYFAAIWYILKPLCRYILWPFYIFYGHFGIFFLFWYVVLENSGSPGPGQNGKEETS